MGNSSSRRRNTNFYQNAPPSQRTSSFTSHPPPPPPPPPNFVFAANAPYPYPSHQTPYYHPPPPPPPPQPSYLYYNNSGYGGRLGHQPPPPVVVAPPPTYVEHQQAKKIRNDVNVHKESIKLEVDEEKLDCHLVSFTFDAVVDCSITVFYFAKDDGDCNFTPLYADAQMQVRVPFEKGLGQKFRQPSGTGIDFGFFELDDLSKPSLREDIFPLVILAEASSPLPPTNEQLHQPRTTKTRAQITQAVIEKSSEGHFQVKVIKQILWVDGVHYELREIYGIGTSAKGGFDDTEPGKECVICMSEPTDTAVLPCRHMCLCSECAKEFRLQTNKCPICRQPIEELIEIKVNKSDE